MTQYEGINFILRIQNQLTWNQCNLTFQRILSSNVLDTSRIFIVMFLKREHDKMFLEY